jgi:hypothetical protein
MKIFKRRREQETIDCLRDNKSIICEEKKWFRMTLNSGRILKGYVDSIEYHSQDLILWGLYIVSEDFKYYDIFNYHRKYRLSVKEKDIQLLATDKKYIWFYID